MYKEEFLFLLLNLYPTLSASGIRAGYNMECQCEATIRENLTFKKQT